MIIKSPPQNQVGQFGQVGQSVGLAMALVMMSLGVIVMMTQVYFFP
ncbi:MULTISPECIES: hypothetical protein [Spirulina sp. CCY15215]|nr:hypothetical protein [Spirulina major]